MNIFSVKLVAFLNDVSVVARHGCADHRRLPDLFNRNHISCSGTCSATNHSQLWPKPLLLIVWPNTYPND